MADVTLERGRVAIDLGEIAYQWAGDGRPLILIHGLAGSSRWWARNMEFFARHFRVYVIDLLGCGDSRFGRPFVLNEAVACLTQWMDQVGIDRASVIGHSMGGFIAAELATDFPDRVEQLVLVDAVALRLGSGYLPGIVDLLRWVRRTPLPFFCVLARDAWQAGLATAWKTVRDLLAADTWPNLTRIQAPTLLVWGEHDSIVPPIVGQRLAEHLSDAQLVLMPASGHYPMWDRPEAFNQVVLDFLQTSGEASASGTTALPMHRSVRR